jgi:hypothetical protein
MALAADEERALTRIEEELSRSDPKLAAKLAMFNRLTRAEAMPERELLTTPGRWRRLSAQAGIRVARWRLYPPVPPRRLPPPGPRPRPGRRPAGAHLGHPQPAWPGRFLALLPVIVTVCAMGAIVAIFSVLGHVGSGPKTPAPVSCQSVTLSGCQSVAHAAHARARR